MNASPLAIALFCLAAIVPSTVAAPPTADELIAKAGAKAAAENKTIYVRFSASWCGWCKRHDAFLESSAVKPAFERYFVPVKITVQESDEHKGEENKGGDDLLKKVGGPEGLPYSAFLDAKGALIVNSKRPAPGKEPSNIGHPFAPEEIDWFISMMKKAAPRMAPADLTAIESALRAQKK